MFENGAKSQKQPLQSSPNNSFRQWSRAGEKKKREQRTVTKFFINAQGLDSFLLLQYSI